MNGSNTNATNAAQVSGKNVPAGRIIAARVNPILAQDDIRRVDLEQITAPTVYRGAEKTAAELRRLFRRETAKEFAGSIRPGCHVFGFTKGQFSLIDLVRAIAEQVGRCEFTVSTWTIARSDMSELAQLKNFESTFTGERFTRVRFLVDISFQRREPGLINHLRQQFGNDSIRVTRNHAKFCLFKTETLRLVVRTSMNLNGNPRLEDVDLADDPALFAFIEAILDDLWSKTKYADQAKKNSAALTKEFLLE